MLNSSLENKIILITGGSGSIGSYLIEKLIKTPCKAIRVFSNNENELYELRKKYSEEKKLRYFLGDIKDSRRLKIALENVHIVLHAAALKHVPICEYNPYDAVQTNVIGTQNVIEMSIQSNVEKFVLISTDKAANPTSTLGGTKLLAEKLTVAGMSYSTHSQKPIMYCVRFGNVLGSRGSVYEIFQEQIQNNESITITDKEMTRFVMTKDEATDLILSTIPIAKGGEIFVLKMKSMKILDFAKSMILFNNKKLEEYKIIETGIREGEKIHEELVTIDEFKKVKKLNDLYVIPSILHNYLLDLEGIDETIKSDSLEKLTDNEILEMIKKISKY